MNSRHLLVIQAVAPNQRFARTAASALAVACRNAPRPPLKRVVRRHCDSNNRPRGLIGASIFRALLLTR